MYAWSEACLIFLVFLNSSRICLRACFDPLLSAHSSVTTDVECCVFALLEHVDRQGSQSADLGFVPSIFSSSLVHCFLPMYVQ